MKQRYWFAVFKIRRYLEFPHFASAEGKMGKFKIASTNTRDGRVCDVALNAVLNANISHNPCQIDNGCRASGEFKGNVRFSDKE